MSELLGYVERHPWWTLIYLCLLGSFFTSGLAALGHGLGRRK